MQAEELAPPPGLVLLALSTAASEASPLQTCHSATAVARAMLLLLLVLLLLFRSWGCQAQQGL